MSFELEGRLLVAGAGKMGGALIDGLMAHGLAPDQLLVQDPSPPEDVAARLARRSIRCVTDATAELSEPPQILLLALKPQVMADVLPPLAAMAGPDTLVISVAAGKTLASLAEPFSVPVGIVRAMPNMPASIGEGVTVCVANAAVNEAQRDLSHALLSSVGDVVWIDDEALMDAVTAVSGSGPAYVFLLAEALAEAGVRAGLDRALSDRLVRGTIAGAGQLLRQSATAAADLRQAVTSPGGTTAAALDVLMQERGLTDLLQRAVAAAAKRSRGLAE